MAARLACGHFLNGSLLAYAAIPAADDVPGRLDWFAPFQP
jgi:hypothetical protein